MNILITGASSGIGKALAIKYAEQGHNVIACGRNQTSLDNLSCNYHSISTLVCDLTHPEQIKKVSGNIPTLDLLILNAGDCEYIDNARHFDGELFARIINTNLVSVGYCLSAWLPHLNNGGQLAITSSSAVFLPLPRAEAYGASKAGLTYLAKSLSVDLQAHNINVSVVHPGFVSTRLTDKNTFAMPLIISAEKSADYIIKGLKNKKVEINFPKRFIFMMKLCQLLPTKWWHKIATNISK